MVLLEGLFVVLVLAATAIPVAHFRRARPAATPVASWLRKPRTPSQRALVAVSIAAVGWAITVAIMIPVGLGSRAVEADFDRPIYHRVAPQVHAGRFTTLMSTLTTIGNRSTMETVALVSLLILAIAYGRRWWVPTVSILAVVAMQREGQDLLTRLVHRDHPAMPYAGVFPSGGVSRLIAVYGVVIALSLALLPPTQQLWRARAWSGLAMFAVIEAFSRVYLSLHWTTDAICGLVFGSLLLAVSIAALDALTGNAPDGPASARDIAGVEALAVRRP
jgi:hypothetical protein